MTTKESMAFSGVWSKIGTVERRGSLREQMGESLQTHPPHPNPRRRMMVTKRPQARVSLHMSSKTNRQEGRKVTADNGRCHLSFLLCLKQNNRLSLGMCVKRRPNALSHSARRQCKKTPFPLNATIAKIHKSKETRHLSQSIHPREQQPHQKRKH